MTPSLTEPLTPVSKIPTKGGILKILRVGDDLLLGSDYGYLEVFDLKNSNIKSTTEFGENITDNY